MQTRCDDRQLGVEAGGQVEALNRSALNGRTSSHLGDIFGLTQLSWTG